MNKTLLIIVIVIVIGAAAFFAGLKIGESKQLTNRGFADFRNLSAKERQQRFQEMGISFGQMGGRQVGANFINGEIIAKDDKSITVKLRNGGSKIVFYSETTEVGKFVNGASSDLDIGETITVSGTTNNDGSITAKSIQIRPLTPDAAIPGQP